MNPRIKKIGRNILFLLSIPAIIGAFVFANTNKQDEKLSSIHIDIKNPDLSFVTDDDVLKMITSEGVAVHQSIVGAIHTNQLENTIKENKWVKDAEIFITANHALNVKVTQKKPVVRINQNDSVDYAYYLDQYANPIELSDQYISKVPVVTAPTLGYVRKDLEFKNDLVELAQYITADTFWNAMITQINVDDEYHIELIPAMGNHVILLGTIADLDSKMKRLLAFYQNGLTTIDWNRYNQIDLRFAHQVVARNTAIRAFPEVVVEEEKKQEKEIQKAKAAVRRQVSEQKEVANKNIQHAKKEIQKKEIPKGKITNSKKSNNITH